jgi:CubicO group peptidase (beta-lactamase class C family)
MTQSRMLSVTTLTAALLGFAAAACQPDDQDALSTPSVERYAGPFSDEEGRVLRERWDYVEGWFGGDAMRFGHLNVDRLVPTVPLESSDAVRILPEAPQPDVAELVVATRDRGPVTLDDYVSNDPRIDGFIVLQDGEIVYERYVHMRPEDRHLHWSISKMVAGFIVSELEDEGLVDVSRPVDHYIPDLVGTDWEGITVRNILDMTSGIACAEDAAAYADIESCMLVMERSVGLNPELPTVSFRGHMAAMSRGIEQGTRYEYASANTSMLMYLAEELTGQTYPDLVSERVWPAVVAEDEALIVSGDYAKGEAAAAHGGLITTLRDLGRLGLFMLEQEGFHRKLLDDARPALFQDRPWDAYATAGDQPTHAAWQTDVVFADGDFGKGGWGGQFLYVSPSRNMVIAWFGTFGDDMVEPDLQSVARQLATRRRPGPRR